MSVACEPMPMPDGELEWWVNYAKTLPNYSDAQYIENALRKRLYGLCSSDDQKLLDSIRSHFFETVYEKIYSEVRTKLEDRLAKSYGLPKLYVSDDQVAEAVIKIQEKFSNRRDQYSIYRILVDLCGWPSQLTDFCERFSRLPFSSTLCYPTGYNPSEPSKSSLYQAIQAYKKKQDWPFTYDKWLKYPENDKTFNHVRDIAKEFLKILKQHQNDTMDEL